jgi:Kef-type K+ transport system membrane component KefB
MTYATLSVIMLVGLLGPLLAMPRGWHLPIVIGELIGGIALGTTGLGYLRSSDPTFTFLGNLGFALVMFIAGSHVPVRDPNLRKALGRGLLRAVLVGAAAVLFGIAVAKHFGSPHAPLYAVLMASSSAALILPIVDSLHLGGTSVLQLLPQVAVADTVCIVALPLAIDPTHAARAAVGALLVLVAAGGVYLFLSYVERSGRRAQLHRISEQRKFALELRISLVILFALAAIAVHGHVSIMLAGFACGLAVTAVGEPRRLARQLFALAEGFLAPLFFVWLGASLNLRALGQHPQYILLGVVLGAGAVLAHAVARLVGQPLSLGMLAGAQLGVPVAAATVGSQLGVLPPGEPAALILAALVTIAAAVFGGSLAVRAGLVAAPVPPSVAPNRKAGP